jgi:hypothetical protein
MQQPVPNSGGAAETGEVPATKPFEGEITVSTAEAAALRALHFGSDDESEAARRASKESGLTADQIKQLRDRSDRARAKGIAIKGPGLVLKPTKGKDPEAHGLLGASKKSKDLEGVRGGRSYTGGKVADAAAPKK